MRNLRIVILLVLLVMVASVLAACGTSGSADTSADSSAFPISNLSLSADKSGANPATTFAPTDTIYLSADINQMAAGTSVDIKWFALDVAGQDPNTPFFTSNVAYSSGSTLTASTNSTTAGFPAGQYRVEVDINGQKVAEQNYAIQ